MITLPGQSISFKTQKSSFEAIFAPEICQKPAEAKRRTASISGLRRIAHPTFKETSTRLGFISV